MTVWQAQGRNEKWCCWGMRKDGGGGVARGEGAMGIQQDASVGGGDIREVGLWQEKKRKTYLMNKINWITDL